MKAWFHLSRIEDVELTPIETRYIWMFQMWKEHKLWPWQWGFADEPYYEHILALRVMDDFYKSAEQFWNKDKENKESVNK